MTARQALRVFAAATATTFGLADLAESQAPIPRLQLVEELRIDGEKEDFSPIQTIFVARDGRIAILFPQDLEVRVYGASGNLSFKFGRKGDGPGEFRMLTNVGGWVGDTLWVNSSLDRRLTLIGPDGKLVRAVTLPSVIVPATATSPERMHAPTPVALLGDGSMIARIVADQRPIDPLTGKVGEPTSQLVRASATGATIQFVARIPAPVGTFPVTRPGGSMWGAGVPFVAQPLTSYSGDGTRIGFATTDNTAKTSGTFRISVLRTNGDTLLARTYPFVGTPVPQRAIDSVLNLIEHPRSPRPPDVIAEVLDAVRGKIPAVYPYLRGFQLGVDNTIWIRVPGASGALEWRMLDDKGNSIGTVVVPNGSLYAASREHLWAITSNADGISGVVRYRIKQ